MAATYVKITRQEFEDWLYALCPVFERDEKTEGIYLWPLSRYVAIKLSTTLGQTDAVIAKNQGRCRIVFVRRENGKPLAKPHNSSNASFQQCNRTQGWQDNWSEALRGMIASFKGDREHYNRLGKQTQEEYAAEWLALIESVKGWAEWEILRDFRDTLKAGYWLTGRQEGAVWKFLRPGAGKKKGGKKSASATRKTSGTVDRELLEALMATAKAAELANDGWTVDFVTGNLRSRVQAGRVLSQKQAAVLREKFTKYGIAVPSAVAA